MPYQPDEFDADDLALLALGERPASAEHAAQIHAHLAESHRSKAELDQLTAVVKTARSIDPTEQLIAPPGRVWDAVRDELDLARSTVTPMRPRRSARSLHAVAGVAAAVGMLVGGGVVFATNAARSPATIVTSGPTIIATAALDPVRPNPAHGVAQLLTQDGIRMVKVDVSDLAPAGNGFYQVWLLNDDASKMISLGALSASDAGIFVIPDSVSIDEYPVVDVSLQALNGSTKHSGDSLVRGALPSI